MTALVLIFGEVLPKTLAITYPESVATRVAPLVGCLILVFSPVVGLVRLVVRAFCGWWGCAADPDGAMLALREEIAGAIALGHSEGAVEKEDRDRLLGRAGPGRPHGGRDHAPPPPDRDGRCRPDPRRDPDPGPGLARTPACRSSAADDNILGVIHAKDLLREVDRLVRGAMALKTRRWTSPRWR
jgi:Mg2+/Co2+ transporter CorB